MSNNECIALCRRLASHAGEKAAQSPHGERFLRLADEWNKLANEMDQKS
jgi:hypothetical protein